MSDEGFQEELEYLFKEFDETEGLSTLVKVHRLIEFTQKDKFNRRDNIGLGSLSDSSDTEMEAESLPC